MRIREIPVYGRHGSYVDSGPHAFVRKEWRLVDISAFLDADVFYDDATYPEEQDRGHDPLVAATFAKGAATVRVRLPASELAGVLGLDFDTLELAGLSGG